ncbi:transketolase [Candidatus Woesearchaeota archaeon]|nr:transketolase [Candidatus Woesearchaeota archaeon]
MAEVRILKRRANAIRKDIIKMISEAGSGHPAGALGMADIFAVLYFSVLNHKPKRPDWLDRDRLVLSNGHICAVRYAAMAHRGYFPVKELKTFRKLGSRLQGHPSYLDMPSLESSSGSLGHGLSIAVGMALAAKLDNKNYKVYCVVSDGELNEGSSWEAVNAANKWALDNLIVIVDRNYIQISGRTEHVWPLDPLDKKFESYDWNVLEVDGHDIHKLLSVFERANKVKGKPVVIIANTVPGKGVPFMENDYEWHGKPPSKQEAEFALLELEKNG